MDTAIVDKSMIPLAKPLCMFWVCITGCLDQDRSSERTLRFAYVILPPREYRKSLLLLL